MQLARDGEDHESDTETTPTAHRRVVSRSWPRDPKGGCITLNNGGKMAPNQIELWGATLDDFYHVLKIPESPRSSDILSGSMLAAWMKANDELEYAAQEIARAEEEESPRQVPPFPMAGLIETTETRITQGGWGWCPMPSTNKFGDQEQKEEEKKKAFASQATSLFDASAYPPPWPLVPFSYPVPTIQSYIPHHRLPKKLIVHDPYNQLAAKEPNQNKRRNASWTNEPDITYVYKLHLLKGGAAQRRPPQFVERTESEIPSGLLIQPQSNNSTGPIKPPVFVVYPPMPPPEPIKEAHLYISPAHIAGVGNHSVVHHAEWEVPRSLLMSPTMCQCCISEDLEKILLEEDAEDRLMNDPSCEEKNDCDNPVALEDAENKVVPQQVTADDKGACAIREEDKRPREVEFGPARAIHTRVSWQSPDAPACHHRKETRPATTKVKVIAKLSFKYDEHLAREAQNYQRFPQHMFEHWNGFNIVPPLERPTPVGALVPQFYGYYLPEDEDSDQYRSPILLMEDCGVQVNPGDLSIDERLECTSLYYRFHYAGWAHYSVAPRNILVQKGPLREPPACRTPKRDGQALSFRLIDFGRSIGMATSAVIRGEKMDVEGLFGRLSSLQ